MDENQRNVVTLNWFVALPNITREEWESREFHQMPSPPKVITQDELSPQALRDRIFDLNTVRKLTRDQYEAGQAVLSGGQPISGSRISPPPDATKKGDLYQHVERGLKKLDEQQEEIGIQIPPGPQQVRGIAGSGKTVLMAMKAARIHLQHPDWNIALTFFTKSLYQHITDLVRRYYWQFAEEEPDWDKFHILHGWGGETTSNGLYYTLSLECDKQPRNRNSAKKITEKKEAPELFDACCKELLQSEQIPQIFDAILIDEAQDFESNFYKLCREALTEPKRLIWAYDEAQSLGSLTAPSAKNMFGEDSNGNPIVDLSGAYKGGIQKSRIMRRAYRSPQEVLMTAHIFGMGLKREAGAIQAITSKEGWDSIGYKVRSGDFRRIGETIELTRPAEHSSHPLQANQVAKPFVTIESCKNPEDEIKTVAKRIRRDIDEHGLAPEQIIAIPVGLWKYGRSQGYSLADELSDYGINSSLAWKEKQDDEEAPESMNFTQSGKVTISRVNRAKGNEAAAIYVLGIGQVDKEWRPKSTVQRRNEAFVAITRSRAWCHITGIDDDTSIFDELRSILDQINDGGDPVVTFAAPDIQNLDHEMESSFETVLDDFTQYTEPDTVGSDDF
jgi:superfamily I DNA and RNA helicase